MGVGGLVSFIKKKGNEVGFNVLWDDLGLRGDRVDVGRKGMGIIHMWQIFTPVNTYFCMM